jgi:hypothetical protein
MTEADESESPAEEPAPPRRKKKRKKKRSLAAEATETRVEPSAVLDANGRERPRFLLAFPDDEALQRLVRAFEAGDFSTIRRDADELAEKSDDPLVRDAALELRRRIDPDPLIKYILLASVLLLGFLVLYVYTHRH